MATEKSSGSGTSATKKSSSDSSSSTRKKASAPRAAARKRMSGPQIAASAAKQLLELTGKGAEGVTGLERTEDGWTVQVEVVEVRRIPDTTDVLALYEVTVDSDGDLEGYKRLRRYTRGVPGEG
jgi:Gas vesicle synthesis protein GvpO